MQHAFAALSLFLALAFCGACAQSPLSAFGRAEGEPAPYASPRAMGMPSKIALPGSSMDTAGGDTLLRKSASLGIEVDRDRVDSVASRAETVVARLGGSTERSSRLPDESAALDFRVPAENLEEVLDALAALGNPTRRSSQIEDVTTQSSDLAAQIENLRGLRDRLRALLARAEKVEEILQIERELNRVQTQLDVYERQQERLLTDVAMSTVSLHVQPIDPPRILGPLGYLGVGLWWVVEKLFVLRY